MTDNDKMQWFELFSKFLNSPSIENKRIIDEWLWKYQGEWNLKYM